VVVGVTGPTSLEGFCVDCISRLLDDALKHIKQCARDHFNDAGAEPPAPRMSLISCLAAGTDQLASQRAHEAGYQLYVVLPGDRDLYRQRLKAEVVPTYNQLLDVAGGNVTELPFELPDGPDDASRQKRYEAYDAASRYMVRRCDLLIAVADITGRQDLGATGEAIRMALRAGKPVLWIDPRRPETLRWLSHLTEPEFVEVTSVRLDLRDVPPLKEGPSSEKRYPPQVEQPESDRFVRVVLASKVKRILDAKQEVFDNRRTPTERTWWERAFAAIFQVMVFEPLPTDVHEHVRPAAPRSQLGEWWHDYTSGLKLLCAFWGKWFRIQRDKLQKSSDQMNGDSNRASADQIAAPAGPMEALVDQFACHVQAEREHPREVSSFYAGLHRSSVWLMCFLGVVAVAVASIGSNWQTMTAAPATTQPVADDGINVVPLLEMGVLALMLAVFLANRMWEWQEKSINFRLYAERQRHGGMLMLLGVDPVDTTTLPAQYADLHPHKTWVGLAFERTVNRLEEKFDRDIKHAGKASMADLLADPRYLDAARRHLRDKWINEQATYFDRTANRYEALHLILESIGFSALILTFALCLLHAFGRVDALSFVGSVGPALGGAAGALGAQAEVGRLRDRARAMHRSLYRRRWQFDRLDGRPLEVQQRFAEATARELLNEVAEWRVVFKFRPIKSPG
jgi:hypothetical protein